MNQDFCTERQTYVAPQHKYMLYCYSIIDNKVLHGAGPVSLELAYSQGEYYGIY